MGLISDIWTYPVQVSRDIAIGIDDGLVATQLLDLADNHDMSVHVRAEKAAVDARGRSGLHDVFG